MRFSHAKYQQLIMLFNKSVEAYRSSHSITNITALSRHYRIIDLFTFKYQKVEFCRAKFIT